MRLGTFLIYIRKWCIDNELVQIVFEVGRIEFVDFGGPNTDKLIVGKQVDAFGQCAIDDIGVGHRWWLDWQVGLIERSVGEEAIEFSEAFGIASYACVEVLTVVNFCSSRIGKLPEFDAK